MSNNEAQNQRDDYSGHSMWFLKNKTQINT
jgi:hypothetical protein